MTRLEKDVARATELVRAAQRDLDRELSNGERRDLLKDNTDWPSTHVAFVVGRLGDCVPEDVPAHRDEGSLAEFDRFIAGDR